MQSLALKNRNADRIDYGFLKEVLPYNVTPSDLDGYLACNNGVLFLEWKKPNYEIHNIKIGQKKALQNLAKKNTVWIIEGESNPDKFYIMNIYKVVQEENFIEKIGYGVNNFKKLCALFFWENS